MNIETPKGESRFKKNAKKTVGRPPRVIDKNIRVGKEHKRPLGLWFCGVRGASRKMVPRSPVPKPRGQRMPLKKAEEVKGGENQKKEHERKKTLASAIYAGNVCKLSKKKIRAANPDFTS